MCICCIVVMVVQGSKGWARLHIFGVSSSIFVRSCSCRDLSYNLLGFVIMASIDFAGMTLEAVVKGTTYAAKDESWDTEVLDAFAQNYVKDCEFCPST